MTRRLLLPLLLAVPLLLAGAPARAEALAPEALVRQVTRDVLASIEKDPELRSGDRDKALALAEAKILPHVDFEAATRLAVGRDWTKASASQRARLVEEFRSMLVRVYSSAIGVYSGQTMTVRPVRMEPGASDVTVRNSFLSPGRPPVAVDYAMHRTGEGWKIYDIVVEGASLVLTYRSQFATVVRADGIDGLITRLGAMNRPTR